MVEQLIQLLEDFEPTISSIVGLLTLCAAVWGVVQLTLRGRRKNAEAAEQTASAIPAGRGGAWQSLFNLGLTEHSKLEELVSVRTVNVVLFCLLVVSFPWLLFCLLLGQSLPLTLLNLVVFSGTLLCFALQRAGATTTARWLVIIIIVTYWLGALFTVGEKQGTEYFLAAMVAMPVLILSRAQAGQRLLCIALIAGAYAIGVAATAGRPSPQVLDPRVLEWGYYVNALFLAGVVFASVSYYKHFAATSYQLLSFRKRENDELVSRFIPADLVQRMVNEEAVAARWHPEGTVLVGSLTGFADLYTRLPAIDLVTKLDTVYSRFDEVLEANGVEKVKSLGTKYVAAAGLNDSSDSYASIARSVLAMRLIVADFAREEALPIGFRCGVATGLTISGVIGKSRPRFDIWGEALDAAAQLEASAGEEEIVVNEQAYWRLERQFSFAAGADPGNSYLLLGRAQGNGRTPQHA
jgi:class 3 adenylate cyclase